MDSIIASTPILAFAILGIMMFVGDTISFKTKARIPALLIFVVLLMIGAWSNIFPSNIIEVPGFTSSYASYIILMFLVDMGSAISIKQFIAQWKTVVIGVCALLGIALVIMTLGVMFVGLRYAAVSAPTIGGGFVAAIEMSNAARALGDDNLARFPSLIFAFHCIPAYIILPIFLKKYGQRLLKNYSTEQVNEAVSHEQVLGSKRLIDYVPMGCRTPAFYLMSLAVLALLAFLTAKVFNNIVSPTVFGLLYGVLATRFGILESGSMAKSGSQGFLMFSSLITIFAPLASSQPSEIAAMFGMLLFVMVLGIMGIFIGSLLSGKLLKVPFPLAISIGLNGLLGFPMNAMLTQESIKALTVDEKKSEYLTQQILPSMLIAGFVMVTIGSVVFASIMKNFL